MGSVSTSSSSDGVRTIWKKVWSAHVPSKVRVFVWKVINNGLPTRENKHHRHLEQSRSCELCGHPREDCFHAIITCPHARALRQELRKQFSLPAEKDLVNSGPEWLLAIIDRNKVLQEGAQISIAGSALFLIRYIDALFAIRQQPEMSDARGKQKLYREKSAPRAQEQPRKCKKWMPPEGEALKINVDGAYLKESERAAIGVVIRDSSGAVRLTAWRTLRHCRDAEEAEAQASLEGIRLATRWPDCPMVFESDCQVIESKLQMGGGDRSLVAPLLREALQEASQLLSIRVEKIGREQNKVAHELAHLALRSDECCVLLGNAPECVNLLLCNDFR